MLHLIKNAMDSFINLLTEDPVRPNIPYLERVGKNKDVFVLRDDEKVHAVTCVSYQSEVPQSEDELFTPCEMPTIVVFYTIWSYTPGSGRTLIFAVLDYLKENKPEINRFVTLSPKTEMAKKFHIGNGAVVFRENEKTVNYEYLGL
jgi:hypothetical protein